MKMLNYRIIEEKNKLRGSLAEQGGMDGVLAMEHWDNMDYRERQEILDKVLDMVDEVPDEKYQAYSKHFYDTLADEVINDYKLRG